LTDISKKLENKLKRKIKRLHDSPEHLTTQTVEAVKSALKSTRGVVSKAWGAAKPKVAQLGLDIIQPTIKRLNEKKKALKKAIRKELKSRN